MRCLFQRFVTSIVASEGTVKSSTSTCWVISNGSAVGLTVTSDSMNVPSAHGSTWHISFV